VSTKPAAIATRRARAKAIKLGDKICNVVDVTSCPPADSDVARRREYLAWSVAVVGGCRGSGGAVVGRPRSASSLPAVAVPVPGGRSSERGVIRARRAIGER
jgi:hypothetical protein